MHNPHLNCRILSINISQKRGERKRPIESATLVENFGIKGDVHAGDPIRQVSLLSMEDVERMRRSGLNVGYGDFAENITAENLEVSKIKIGDIIKIKDCELEVTQIGKVCHSRCNIFKQAGYCIMPESGIFARVLKGGEIRVGDEVEIVHNPT